MTEIYADQSALVTWSAPQCPFVIEYSRKALDDIRLAVVDAFFSLPRGGAEIGGILLGRIEDNRVLILDYAPIECEHAFGPAFTLSPADQTRLGEILRQSHPAGLRPVGWYHSHTRSEISLCEADLDIYKRYFPERGQVALVLRPSTLQPTQAGFFFREPDGSIHAEQSYQEFVVEALPLQQVPPAAPDAAAEAMPGPMRETEPEAVVINLSTPEPAAPEAVSGAQAVEEPVAKAMEPEDAPAPAPFLLAAAPAEATAAPFETVIEPSRFEETIPEPADTMSAPDQIPAEESRPRRPWIGIAVGVLAGLALGVLIGQGRWQSRPAAVPQQPKAIAVPAPADAALRSQNEDLRKQVGDLTQQISKLRNENADLGKQQADLSKQQAELAKQQADRNKQQADSGKREADLRQQHDDLVKQNAKLKTDLGAQTARAQSLQQQLEDLRKQFQRRRLSIQSSDSLP